MNLRMQELLAKQASKLLGVSETPKSNDAGVEQPTMPPFVASLLAGFGITPASIEEYANILKNAFLETRADIAVIREQNAEILANQRGIEMKLAELEHTIGAVVSEQIPELAPAPDLNPRVVMSDKEIDEAKRRHDAILDSLKEDLSYRLLESNTNGR